MHFYHCRVAASHHPDGGQEPYPGMPQRTIPHTLPNTLHDTLLRFLWAVTTLPPLCGHPLFLPNLHDHCTVSDVSISVERGS